MICKKCGEQYDDGVKFCSCCGSEVEIMQQSVNVSAQETEVLADSDGNIAEKEGEVGVAETGGAVSYCEECGAPIMENEKFCIKCGTAVQDQKSADAAMLVKKVSKKEYFATLCSPKAKRLMLASWGLWVLSSVVLLLNAAQICFLAFAVMHLLLIVSTVTALLAIIVGGFACKKKSVPLSVVLLFATLLSVTGRIDKWICLAAAICILIFNIIVNKEYKKYMKLADAK